MVSVPICLHVRFMDANHADSLFRQARYPARVSANVPRSLRARLIEKAQRENVSLTEIVRRLLAQSISDDRSAA